MRCIAQAGERGVRRRQMKNLFITLLLLMPSIGMAQLAHDELGRLEAVDAWVSQAFRPRALETVQGIRSLGRLLYENRHRNQLEHAAIETEVREFVFEGLAIHAFVEKAAPHRAWVTAIEITSPCWSLENGLKVGQNVAELERLPVQAEAESLRFCGVNNCLLAEERDGDISGLRLEIYLD